MKKEFIGLVIMLLIAAKSFAGYDVLFCTNYDSLGHCKESSNEFKWNGEKLKLHMLVLNKDGLNTTKLSFKIFFLKDDGEHVLQAELSTAVKSKWFYAMKDAYFFKPGRYRINIYNDKMNAIADAYVTITDH